jgi:acetyl-CoA carboxylase carboxyl transferase subunit beta
MAWVEAAIGLRDTRLPGRPLPAPMTANGGPSVAAGPWLEVLRARARSRPTGIDHAARLCDSWVELRGADQTLRAGIARIGDRRVVVVASDRYAGTGRPGPGGYRLLRRALALAGRLRVPFLTFVDTPGADPGPVSEANGIAAEIAETFAALSEAEVQTVAVCVGEGGGGGAFAMAACDRMLLLEHAVFSVIGPEAAAAILARDAGQAATYAGRLRLTAADAAGLGIADEVVPEADPATVDTAIIASLNRAVPGDRLRRLDAVTARWVR